MQDFSHQQSVTVTKKNTANGPGILNQMDTQNLRGFERTGKSGTRRIKRIQQKTNIILGFILNSLVVYTSITLILCQTAKLILGRFGMTNLQEEVTFTEHSSKHAVPPTPPNEFNHITCNKAPRAMLWLPSTFKKPDLLSGIIEKKKQAALSPRKKWRDSSSS